MTSWSESGPWVIPETTVHQLDHEQRSWRVTVARPTPASPAESLTPVVYVLDPLGTLGTAVQVARSTHLLSQGALPALLIVGVGPASDDLAEVAQRRGLDLTPTAPSPAMPAGQPGAEPAFGGGDAFLDVLLDVVAPFVEKEYAGDPADRTIAGWSLAGLLGAHALLTRPQAFRRYLLVSPSLWWADAEILTRVEDLSNHPGPLDVYASAGDLEQTAAARSWPAGSGVGMDDARMLSNLATFSDSLRSLQLPELRVHTDVLRGEHHLTVWPAAFSRGLLALHAASYRLE